MAFFTKFSPLIESFNTWTSPIAFFLTLFTFILSFNTRRKIEETKEIALFNDDLEGYLARLEGIRIAIDSIEDRNQAVPEKIIIEISKIALETKKRYPVLSTWRPEIRRPLKKINKLREKKIVTLNDFLEPFNELAALFWTRKEFPK
ncbi:hypothetical protein [Streptococcus phocae]|uniref:Uncharacterized protein n=1 Tax=Streptococcus phocae TaxID=119224 RepID=A0A0P6S316_9STRE|nr:hypothetical protein [Streptococcus phocae]KPJ21784.1 hypothetical protein AKK44_07880 [Streptococcus phocae]